MDEQPTFDPTTFGAIPDALLNALCNVIILAGVIGIVASLLLIIARSPKGPTR